MRERKRVGTTLSHTLQALNNAVQPTSNMEARNWSKQHETVNSILDPNTPVFLQRGLGQGQGGHGKTSKRRDPIIPLTSKAHDESERGGQRQFRLQCARARVCVCSVTPMLWTLVYTRYRLLCRCARARHQPWLTTTREEGYTTKTFLLFLSCRH